MTYRSNLLPKLRDINVGSGMNEILPGLYVGNLRDSKDSRQLDIHKITHILSIHDDEARKPFKEKKYLIISAADSPKQDLAQYISQTNDFIHAARFRGGHVLIHCVAGISRSVTIAGAYIMSVTNMNHQEAFQAIRSARNAANPNIGFQRQLYEFEISGACDKERERLFAKFHPHSAANAINSTRKNGSKNTSSPSSSFPGILKKTSHRRESIPFNPSSFPGRLTMKSAFNSNLGQDDLSVNDREKCIELLENYRKQVLNGDICAGDCPNDGISCTTGVCRAHLRSTSWSLLRRHSTIRRPSTMFASTNENFWTIWSIDVKDQIRHSLAQERDFHGCTGSPFKRPNSSPTKPRPSALGSKNTCQTTRIRSQDMQPSPILKKSLVKVKSDSSLTAASFMNCDYQRHHRSIESNQSRERFLKVPTMSNLMINSTQFGGLTSDIKSDSVHLSNEDLPHSLPLSIKEENTHGLRRHVSWSDTTTKRNMNYDMIIPTNRQIKPAPEIRIELDNSLQRS